MRDWWASQDGRVTPFWLPAHPPNLNLTERVWRFVKQKLACRRFWVEVKGLEATAATLLDRVKAHFHAKESPGTLVRKKFGESAWSG